MSIKAKEPIFDIHNVVKQYEQVTQPNTEEELVGVMLRHVLQAIEEHGLTEYGITNMTKQQNAYVFQVQGKKDNELVENDITVNYGNEPAKPSGIVARRFMNKETYLKLLSDKTGFNLGEPEGLSVTMGFGR